MNGASIGYGSDSKAFRRLNPHLFPTFAPSAPTKGEIQEEQLHEAFEAWLIAAGYLYVHARMDKRSSIQVGHPDFTCFFPERIVVFIEFKQPGKKTTLEQNSKIAHARKYGFTAEVCDNADAAIQICQNAMKQKC